MKDKVVLFSPETFNLAETTRCIEVAKAMPKSVKCIFSGYSEKFSYVIEEAGFDFFHLKPHMSEKDIQAMMRFDQGRSIVNPLNTRILRQRVYSEIELIRKMGVSVTVIGSTLSMFISSRACKRKIVYIKPYAFSKGHLLQLSQQSNYIGVISRFLLRVHYIPKSFRIISAELKIQPFQRTIDLVEADYNLITTLPELLGETHILENDQIVGPIYAKMMDKNGATAKIPSIIAEAKNKQLPTIYFAMGSSSNKRMILKILTILKNLQVTVVAPVKSYLKAEEILHFQATNIHIFNWLPAAEVSQMVDLSFIHGGEGSVQTACQSGKPFLGIGLQVEQKENLNLCQQFGNALRIKKINQRVIVSGINQLLNGPSFSQKATLMKAYMDKSKGAENASEFIVNLLKNS